MPTGKLNLKWVAARITEKQMLELTDLVLARRVDPRQAKMEKQREKLMTALRKIDDEIAALTDAGKPSAKRPGRKPGNCAIAAPKAVKPAKTKKPARNDPARAAMLERMAKARAARAAKRAAGE